MSKFADLRYAYLAYFAFVGQYPSQLERIVFRMMSVEQLEQYTDQVFAMEMDRRDEERYYADFCQ